MSAGFGWIGVRAYIGANWYALVLENPGDPHRAFNAVAHAYSWFPLAPEHRRQLGGSFAYVIQQINKDLVIDAATAEDIWRVSQTLSPYDTLSLVSRATYLLNFGQDLKDMPMIVNRLLESAHGSPHSWLIASFWAYVQGNRELTRQMARKGLSLSGPDAGITEKLREMENLE